jgi:glycerol-1-phosphate dehydrogenase [NAD(P)+]
MEKESVYNIGEGTIKDVPGVFYSYFGSSSTPCIFADENTWIAAGELISTQFEGKAEVFLFPKEQPVYADYENVVLVKEKLQQKATSIGIVVGSGTINDLVKLASFELKREYMLFPTAPSVDGYTSTGSALTVEGFKQTVYCLPPAVLVADASILKASPSPMIAAGYGDLAAKITAGADWIIADSLGIEPIDTDVWLMVQKDLRRNISEPQALSERNPKAIERLFDGLAQTGYAIKKYVDSRPASGAEHLMSHVWEMDHLAVDGEPVSHGFKVALGTLATTALYEELLSLDQKDLKRLYQEFASVSWCERLAYFDQLLDPSPMKATIIEVARSKFLGGRASVERRELILSRWDEIKDRIAHQIIPFNELRETFILAHCPVEPITIALSREALEKGLRIAQLIRKRYTSLDLMYEIGGMDAIVHTLAHTDKYFSEFHIQEKTV